MKENINENRILELSQKCYDKWIDQNSNFLNLSELEEFNKIKNKLPSNFLLTGGIENTERKLVIFSMQDDIDPLNFISIIEVCPKDFKFGENLSHRNYLGALMNLGIERNTIGDILVNGKIGYLICQKKISEHIVQNLHFVNKTAVNLKVLDSIPENLKIRLKELSISSASNRVDLIISKIFDISRKESSELFVNKSVYVNDKLMLNNSYFLKENDIVSVSGFGRFLFVGQLSITKKGNIVYLIKKYV